MGIFSNLFKSKEDTLSEDLALLIVDYSVKFYNSVVSNLDEQYEEALSDKTKVEFYCFTYQLTDRVFNETFSALERMRLLNMVDKYTHTLFLVKINRPDLETRLTELINERQDQYSQFSFITEQMTDTIFFEFGKILAKTISFELDPQVYLVPMLLAEQATEFMAEIGILYNKHRS
jgi:hypothetical protein